YNSKDDCCFEAGYVLPALRAAAEPIFKLHGKGANLRYHVNDDPGTHNYEKDNRQALYRMLGDHFYAGRKDFDRRDIPSDKEVKSKADLNVDVPARNADFHTLAQGLAARLPRSPDLPSDREAAHRWQETSRKKLRQVVMAKRYLVKAAGTKAEDKDGLRVRYWKVNVSGHWTVPVVELARGQPKATAILVNDAGRRTDAATVEYWLKSGHRVLAADLFYFGESRIPQHDWLFALMVATIGDRPLGIQASQLAALALWSSGEHKSGPV